MNWNQIAGEWHQAAGKVRAKWGKLTDDDLALIAGKREELSGILQSKYGEAKEEVERQIDEFETQLRDDVSRAPMTHTRRLLAAALMIVVSAGCRGEAQEPVIPAAAKTGKSMVRMINAMPSPRAVQLTGDERTLFSDVHYKDVTAYTEVRDDLITLRVLVADDKPLADNHEILTDGDRYTAIVVPDGKGGTRLRVLRDDVARTAGQARIRVINASPAVRDAAIALLSDSKPLFSGVDFATTDGYKDVAPGTVTLDIRKDAKHVTPMVLKSLHLEAGKAYTFVIIGGNGSPVEVFSFEDAVELTTALRGS